MDEPIQLKVKKLHPDAMLPTRGSERAAGLDLFAWLNKTEDNDSPVYHLSPGHHILVLTGIAVEIPDGFEGQIRPRSGLALKHGITVLNAPGTIDSDYRGEVGVILVNHGNRYHIINHGDRIAQLVVAPVTLAKVTEVEELSDTTRGEGGYGSTGR
jgi:dUTP pyrophosphatase